MLLDRALLGQTSSMRSRYPSVSNFAYSFGPGPLTPAIKILIGANVAAYVVSLIVPAATRPLRLSPAEVTGQLHLWQPVTYMFLHTGILHLLFNMLSLYMFGVELERTWGSKFFTKYYFATGIGAAATTILLSFVPGSFGDALYGSVTIGASGAVYGILLAYGMYFPNRPIYVYGVFPLAAKYLVMIMGGISLLSSMSGPGSGVAHTTHLGGLIVGYLYLKGTRTHLLSEIQYRLLKWRINRMRRKFDVHPGGRAKDFDRRVH
jgi:membrane associated rhomboid family serine protease